MANRWDKTYISKRRLEDKLKYMDGVPYYQGRFLIERESPIDGGVYLGQGQREAIIVDSQKGIQLKKLYEIAKKKASENNKVKKYKVMDAVFETVGEFMKFDEDKAEEIVKEKNAGKDVKINLDCFIENGVGVCRHMALTCGVLIEMFKKDGYVSGKPSVERNSSEAGGHAWCRYTDNNEKSLILDVARGYIGLLENGICAWNYKRPSEI
ncbi:MAG: hypothetical protein Q7S33_03985 [Nanoarchaeota archaeon]|nr:hypothetical protein [Nanoarchaeota archaeon]